MKREAKRRFYVAVGLLAAFVLWTLAIRWVDVEEVGPMGSSVGFATVNQWFHRLTGVHMALYTVTDWLSLIPLGIVFGFGCLGLYQWIARKSLFRVDRDILILGGFYVAVMGAYLLFEVVVLNFRPVLINGILEASYPSSTTMLVLCVMLTAGMQLRTRIKGKKLRWGILAGIALFTAFMVVGRMLSGVHWLTDIIGGILLSTALVTAYCGAVCLCRD